MRLIPLLFLPAFLLTIISCSSLKPIAFQKEGLTVQPMQFFVGKTSSYGVIENAAGKPTAQITTNTIGILKDAAIHGFHQFV